MRPGLVGGHCIGVDPYYLAYQAESHGVHAQIILAGRSINDCMTGWVARKCVKAIQANKIQSPKILIMGLTFKEDCQDMRNSKSFELMDILISYGCDVFRNRSNT